MVQSQVEDFIPNDTQLTRSRQLLLITGPNMGGKSTYMRQVAQIALLAYCGAYVPARSACLGPIDRIFTRIGASDDLAGGRSTFMVEMSEAASILNNATPRRRKAGRRRTNAPSWCAGWPSSMKSCATMRTGRRKSLAEACS